MNLPRGQLEEVSLESLPVPCIPRHAVAALLPSEQSPTVSDLVDSEFVAVETAVKPGSWQPIAGGWEQSASPRSQPNFAFTTSARKQAKPRTTTGGLLSIRPSFWQ
eukprot:scaffold517599_cov47-Prasinocladus_malaysianus.AAC.3